MQRRISLLDWVLTDILILSGCYFTIDLVMALKRAVPFYSICCDVLIFALLIAALFFLQQLIRHGHGLARKLGDDQRFRIANEHAPVSLGLQRNPIDDYEHREDDES